MRIDSPRLRTLQPDGVDEFWTEVTEQGTPMVEPIPGDDRHVWLTFLWRATKAVDNVVVFGGPAGWDPPHNQLRPLEGTDVWYRTYRVRGDLRCTYRISVDDPLTSPDEADDWESRTAGWTPDPLNRSTFTYPEDEELADSRETVMSVIELPDAPGQPWIEPRHGDPSGQITKHQVSSKLLDNERRVWVYTPPGYGEDDEPHRLLVLFDGDAVPAVIPLGTILDNLIAAGRVPPMVAVLVDSMTQEVRNRELPCNPAFVEFLTDELLPWARERYQITGDRSRIIVGGQSFGGLAAAYAGLRRPDVFGNVLSQSGAFWWKDEWLTTQYAEEPMAPLRFWMEAGLLETGTTPGGAPSLLATNRHLRTVLQAKGYPVDYAEFNGGHDYVCWRGGIADGLIGLSR